MPLLAAQRGLTLSVNCPPLAVSTDTMLFRQILRNLIGNAIKYTDRGGVRVDAPNSGDACLISVRGHRHWHSRERARHVFGEFQQFRGDDGRTRGGVGLGLWIVRRLADQLGHPDPGPFGLGQGTTFTLDLPRAVSSDAVGEASALTPRRAAPVDARAAWSTTTRPVRFATPVFLKMQGFEVVGAATLAEARARLSTPRRFDLIVSDFHLLDDEFGVDAIKFARDYYQRRYCRRSWFPATHLKRSANSNRGSTPCSSTSPSTPTTSSTR